ETPYAEIERVLAAKHSTSEPSSVTGSGKAGAYQALVGPIWRMVKNHPVESLATAGGIAAVPLTGGTSLLPAAAAAGLGGAGGAGVGLIAKAARGDVDTPQTAPADLREMGKQGLTQTAAEGGGRLLQGTLRVMAKPLYRAAVRPAARLTDKYGDLVAAGL